MNSSKWQAFYLEWDYACASSNFSLSFTNKKANLSFFPANGDGKRRFPPYSKKREKKKKKEKNEKIMKDFALPSGIQRYLFKKYIIYHFKNHFYYISIRFQFF